MNPFSLFRASLYKIAKAERGYFVCFRVPKDQLPELKELEKLKKQRLYLVAVTEEEYAHIVGERH